MTRVNLNDGSRQGPLATEARHLDIIQDLVEERDQLRAQLADAQARERAAAVILQKLWQLQETELPDFGAMGAVARMHAAWIQEQEK